MVLMYTTDGEPLKKGAAVMCDYVWRKKKPPMPEASPLKFRDINIDSHGEKKTGQWNLRSSLNAQLSGNSEVRFWMVTVERQ